VFGWFAADFLVISEPVGREKGWPWWANPFFYAAYNSDTYD